MHLLCPQVTLRFNEDSIPFEGREIYGGHKLIGNELFALGYEHQNNETNEDPELVYGKFLLDQPNIPFVELFKVKTSGKVVLHFVDVSFLTILYQTKYFSPNASDGLVKSATFLLDL
jgi:hypothetical protein